jgi:uncharacterized membrane protein
VKRLRRYFLTGLVVTLPTVVTIWLLYKIVAAVDNILDPVQRRLYGMDIPGVGLAVVVVVLLVAGAVGGNYLGRKLVGLYHVLLARVPLAGKIYRAVQQILDVFLRDNTQTFKSVVSVEFPRPGMWALGFVASVTPADWVDAGGERLLNVFVPHTPNPTTGFLLLVPERDVRVIALSVEDAIKVIISGGAVVPGATPGLPPSRPRT